MLMWIARLPRVALGTDSTLTRFRANALLNRTTERSNIIIGYNADFFMLVTERLLPATNGVITVSIPLHLLERHHPVPNNHK